MENTENIQKKAHEIPKNDYVTRVGNIYVRLVWWDAGSLWELYTRRVNIQGWTFKQNFDIDWPEDCILLYGMYSILIEKFGLEEISNEQRYDLSGNDAGMSYSNA